MGNTQTYAPDSRLASAKRAFTPKEFDDLRSLFLLLASRSQSDGRYVSPQAFMDYFGLPGAMGRRLYDLITQKRCDERLTFDDFVISKAIYEKGTRGQCEDFIYKVIDINCDGNLSRSDLEVVLQEIFDVVFVSKEAESGFSSDQDMVDLFLNSLTFSKHDQGHSGDLISFEEFKRWCDHVPSIRKFLGNLLVPGPEKDGSHVPCLLHSKNIDPAMLILRKEHAWHIAGNLPQNETRGWVLLYNSALNGQSFNTFLGSMPKEGEGTVLVIKDEHGYIYGGYASQPWEKHSTFYGDMKCFLFQLYPTASVFRPTGLNNNMQWCGVNFSTEEIPNGVGFGGRPSHFGMFISGDFEGGHSYPCTTFGSPTLSKYAEFEPEVIECWAVVAKSQGTGEGGRGTVLERFKEDRHVLNLVGLADSTH